MMHKLMPVLIELREHDDVTASWSRRCRCSVMTRWWCVSKVDSYYYQSEGFKKSFTWSTK